MGPRCSFQDAALEEARSRCGEAGSSCTSNLMYQSDSACPCFGWCSAGGRTEMWAATRAQAPGGCPARAVGGPEKGDHCHLVWSSRDKRGEGRGRHDLALLSLCDRHASRQVAPANLYIEVSANGSNPARKMPGCWPRASPLLPRQQQ